MKNQAGQTREIRRRTEKPNRTQNRPRKERCWLTGRHAAGSGCALVVQKVKVVLPGGGVGQSHVTRAVMQHQHHYQQAAKPPSHRVSRPELHPHDRHWNLQMSRPETNEADAIRKI